MGKGNRTRGKKLSVYMLIYINMQQIDCCCIKKLYTCNTTFLCHVIFSLFYKDLLIYKYESFWQDFSVFYLSDC